MSRASAGCPQRAGAVRALRVMGRLVALAALAAVLAVVVPGPGPSGAEEAMLTFVDEPLAPLSEGELGQEARGGMVLALLHEVFGRLGREVRLELMPFARALKTVENGQADGLPLLMDSPGRERYLVFSDEVVRDRECFHYRPDRLGDFAWRDYDDLQGLVVGLVIGYAYSESFTRAVEQGRVAVEYASDSESNLRKLLLGRVDLVLEGDFQYLAVVAEHPRWEMSLQRALPEVGSYGWRIGLSKVRPDTMALLPDVNGVLRDMRADGTLARLFGRDGG